MENEKFGLYNEAPVIRTVSGRFVNVFEPKPDMFCIEDIAHALSHQCRFGGHLPNFYSVAQHSFITSQLVEEKDQVTALMHDASEAYLLDVPRPIKLQLANYKEIENGLMVMLAEVFQFQWPLPESVKKADEEMLVTEWNELMLGNKGEKPVIKLSKTREFDKDRFIRAFNYYKA